MDLFLINPPFSIFILNIAPKPKYHLKNIHPLIFILNIAQYLKKTIFNTQLKSLFFKKIISY